MACNDAFPLTEHNTKREAGEKHRVTFKIAEIFYIKLICRVGLKLPNFPFCTLASSYRTLQSLLLCGTFCSEKLAYRTDG